MQSIVAGVDGGASKTRVIIADESGAELGSIVGEGSAVRPGEAGRSVAIVVRLVDEAIAASDLGDVSLAALCVGIAGVGRDAEYSAFFKELSARSAAEELVVLPDSVVALTDAFGEESGILLVGGTGSMAFGRGPTGKMMRCGGWGAVCGDEGSGQWIGRRALSIVTAASDGREPETALLGVLLTHLQMESPEELVPWAATATSAQLAQLAVPVMTVAATGDLRANSLCTLAAEELALHVRTLARRLFADERAAVAVALAGGLLERGTLLRRLVEHRLRSAVPGCQLHAAEVVPARGAVRTALGLLARA